MKLTIELPTDLHATLRLEAKDRKTSVPRLIVSKLKAHTAAPAELFGKDALKDIARSTLDAGLGALQNIIRRGGR